MGYSADPPGCASTQALGRGDGRGLRCMGLENVRTLDGTSGSRPMETKENVRSPASRSVCPR